MNKYNVLSFIGEGSFGRVFKVRNKETEGIFALKVIRKKGLSSKELKSLRLECDIQQHLRHPNIIRMVESFDTDSELGVVTEFAERELHGVLGREGCLQEGRAQALTWDLTSALYYLHSHRVLHRDLKPQNVLIDSTGRAKLCDFGLARNMTTGTHVLTSIKGTPLYMAPELIDEKPYDHQADLWSLGCIVYEMMAGQPPFSTSSIVQLVRLIRHHPVQWPSYISPQAISFLQGLLHKNPSMRLSWPEILVHPFVGGHILILPEQTPIESPFTLPLTQSQMAAKQLQKDKLNNVQRLMPQAVKIMERREQLMAVACKPSVPEGALVSDDDSIRAMSAISMRDSLRTDDEELQPITEVNADLLAHQYKLLNQDNLIISNLDTNMAQLTVQPRINLPAINEKPLNDVEVKNEAKVTKQDDHSNVSKKKLCQNLDNFSIRLKNNSVKEEKDQAVIAQSAGDCNKESNAAEKETVLSKSVPPSYKQKIMQFSRDKFGFGSGNRLTRSLKKSLHLSKMQVKPDRSRRMSEPLTVNVLCKDEKEDVKVESDEKADENTPEILENLQLPGDLSSPVHNFIDDDSSPIEKDEWLAFMRSNMNEVMEGDVESLTQQNVVGMMVAVARHAGAGAEVWGSLAALLSLPLVAPHVPRQTISDILRVYLEVKLVPNLVYAARLLVRHGCTENNPLVNRERVLSLSSEETVALCRLLELATQLSLRGAPFVQQLCDAVAVLNIAPLFAHFLSMYDKRLRIVLNTITLLTVILQDLPENAELVESVLLQEDCVNLRVLLTHPSDALKTRSCVLVGLLGRYCCSALDGAWGPQQKEALHVLQRHSNQMLSRAAKCAVRDLSKLPFYRQADVDR